MTARRRLSPLPYIVLSALSVVTFGGPLLIFVIVRGGGSRNWPPDRALEWITVIGVFSLFVALFIACVTNGWWSPPPRRGNDQGKP
jgi:hypothetical protein